MIFRDEYKKSFDALVPDDSAKERMLEKLRAEAEKPAFVSRTRPAARYAALAASFVILVAAVIAMPMVLSGQFPLFELGRREAPANEPSYYGDNGAPSAGDAPPSDNKSDWDSYPDKDDENENGARYTRSNQEEADLNEAPPAANSQSDKDPDSGDGDKALNSGTDSDGETDSANGYFESSEPTDSYDYYDCRLCKSADREFCFSTALNALIHRAETVEELRETARYCHKVRSISVKARPHGHVWVTSGELTPGMIVQITMENGSFTETLVTE
jgi:hypothetical protein